MPARKKVVPKKVVPKKVYDDSSDYSSSSEGDSYSSGSDSRSPSPSPRRRRDVKKPVKRAPTAYMIFCKKERPKVVKAHPRYTPQKVMIELGNRWRKYKAGKK